ncbi:MAG: hypothetical protein E7164_00080 [Firmicutes bacterium]|nr:hypothetical protein [Bacillota bacterium]
MEENNQELAIEMPVLKNEQTQSMPNYQNTNIGTQAPILNETREEAIVTNVTPTPVITQVEQPVTTPVADNHVPSAIEMPTGPVTSNVAVAQPTVSEVSVTPVNVENVSNASNDVFQPTASPMNYAASNQAVNPAVVSTETPSVVNQYATSEVPTSNMTSQATTSNAQNVQITKEEKEQGIPKASKKSQLIGTIVLLVITALIVWWLADSYFILD